MKNVTKIVVFIMAGFGCFVLACLGLALISPSPSRIPATPVVISGTPTPTSWAPGYDALCKRDPSLTDVQYVQHLKTFEGKKIVDWTGWVYDVLDGPVVLVAVRPPGGFLWARDIEMVGLGREVEKFNKEDRVVFSGTIRSMGSFLGRPCNPIVLENGEVKLAR